MFTLQVCLEEIGCPQRISKDVITVGTGLLGETV